MKSCILDNKKEDVYIFLIKKKKVSLYKLIIRHILILRFKVQNIVFKSVW